MGLSGQAWSTGTDKRAALASLGHSHGAGHGALQLVQETLHAGPHVLQAPGPVPLGLLFHRGPSAARQAVTLRGAIVRTQSPRQRGARVGLILGEGERKTAQP